MRIEVHDHIPDDGEWDRVVKEAGAPVFYRAALLTAYQRNPLQPTLDVRYLTAEQHGGMTAVLPLYHVPSRDPFADGEGRATSGRLDTWAISHFWHCYDTRLPAVAPTERLTGAMWTEITRQAEGWGASRAVLINVAAGDLVDEHMRAMGAERRDRNPRYRLDLSAFGTLADYEAALPAGVRQDLRRHRRLAARAGVEPVLFGSPLSPEVIVATCDLLAETDRVYNPGYYPGESLATLLRDGGPEICVAALVKEDSLVAASISFADPPVWHNWAIGVDRNATVGFSPYNVLLSATVEQALAQGCERMEMGRTNAVWKQRFGAEPVALNSWNAFFDAGCDG